MVRLAEQFQGFRATRRELVIELLRKVVGTYTLGRLLLPILDDDLAVTMLDAGSLSRELFEFARRNSDTGRRQPDVRAGYNARAQYGLERSTFAASSPFDYFALGTAEQLRKHAAAIWDEIRHHAGGGLAEAGSGNRKMLLSLWRSSLGQGKHDDAAFVWFSPVRPSTWDYLQICGDRSPFTQPTRDRASTGMCRLAFDMGSELAVDLRKWRRSVPKRHCASSSAFEVTTVRRGAKSPGDWQSRHWREAGVTPFGVTYDEWIADNTTMGALTLNGGHTVRCYTDANLLVGRFAPIDRGFGAFGRMLYMALDWTSGCVTAIQLNAIDFDTFLRLTPQARVLLRHGLGL